VASPMATMATPEMRTISGRCRSNAPPARPTDTPRSVNTVVNPATKSTAARRVTARASSRPSSDTGSADT